MSCFINTKKQVRAQSRDLHMAANFLFSIVILLSPSPNVKAPTFSSHQNLFLQGGHSVQDEYHPFPPHAS